MFRVTAFVVKFVKNSFRKVKGEAVFNSHDSQLFCSEQEITLKFNLDGTLWWGGFRERLVGMVKNCLKKLIGSERLSKTELSTVLFEIENVFNNRPMCFMCDGDLPRYLRQTVYCMVGSWSLKINALMRDILKLLKEVSCGWENMRCKRLLKVFGWCGIENIWMVWGK